MHCVHFGQRACCRPASRSSGEARINAKAPVLRPGLLVYGSLTMTYFRMQRSTLSSARLRFTALFGMGRGGTRVLWSSENLVGVAVRD